MISGKPVKSSIGRTCRPASCSADAVPPVETSSTPSSARRSEEHTSELQSRQYLVCRLLLEKKKTQRIQRFLKGFLHMCYHPSVLSIITSSLTNHDPHLLTAFHCISTL